LPFRLLCQSVTWPTDGRDEKRVGFGGSDGLHDGEREGQVAIDALALGGYAQLESLPMSRQS